VRDCKDAVLGMHYGLSVARAGHMFGVPPTTLFGKNWKEP